MNWYKISERFKKLILLIFSLLLYFLIQSSCFIKTSQSSSIILKILAREEGGKIIKASLSLLCIWMDYNPILMRINYPKNMAKFCKTQLYDPCSALKCKTAAEPAQRKHQK